jgi:hypothetical protein
MNATLVASFEEACKEQGLDARRVLPDVSLLPEKDQKAIIAFVKMCIIQRSLNGDWEADWNDFDQAKYSPWFNVEGKQGSSSGFGLSYGGYGYDCSDTYLGVRLFYKDRETAKYAGTQFVELYEDLILVPR